MIVEESRGSEDAGRWSRKVVCPYRKEERKGAMQGKPGNREVVAAVAKGCVHPRERTKHIVVFKDQVCCWVATR